MSFFKEFFGRYSNDSKLIVCINDALITVQLRIEGGGGGSRSRFFGVNDNLRESVAKFKS